MLRKSALIGFNTLLTACSVGDIVVKTDLDEQYIVKESAVTKMPFDWEIAKYNQENNVKIWKDLLKQAYAGKQKCLSLGLSKKQCDDDWDRHVEGLIEDLEKAKSELERLEELEKKDKDSEELILVVRYRPIFQDINGDKSALGYASATCLNSKSISSEDSKKLFKIMDISVVDTKKKKTAKESAYLSVTKKVCDKYAYANTAFFNYTLDDNQDKDKKD